MSAKTNFGKLKVKSIETDELVPTNKSDFLNNVSQEASDVDPLSASAVGALTATAVGAVGAAVTDTTAAALAATQAMRTEVNKMQTDSLSIRTEVNKIVTDQGSIRTEVNNIISDQSNILDLLHDLRDVLVAQGLID